MKIIVNPHKLEIEKSPVNEKEINITKCEFVFNDIEQDLVKKAFFTLKDTTYEQIIINGECDIPSEVLEEQGQIEIGVIAYQVEDEEYIKRYNPSPAYFTTWKGSLKEAENSSKPTPSQIEQIESEIATIQNDIIDLDNNKQDTLVSGENIKTINNQDLLGSGNIDLNETYYTKEEIDNKGYINKDVDDLTNYTKTSELADVALSGSYNDLSNTPDLSVYSLITETGNKINLEINSSTYVLVAKLYDKNNNLLSTSSGIDLPLETMVVGASYDSTTKEIVLVLKNGQEVRFSVADLVSGLQSEITPSNKLSSDLVDDTGHTNKFVTQSEKTTWNNKSDFSGSYNDLTNKPDLTLKEDKSNKVTEIDENSTDTQYPSAKCVYDSQEAQDTQIEALQEENNYLNSIIDQLPKVSGEGEYITLNNTIEGKMSLELGSTELEQFTTTGKNKLAYTLATIKSINTGGTWNGNVYNWNGIEFTINDDLSVKINGTASGASYLILNNTLSLTSGTEYILNGCPASGGVSSYSLRLYTGSSYESDIGSGKTFTYGSQDLVRLNVSNGRQVNNLVFFPMIRLSTETDTYEPYTNGASPNPSYPQQVHTISGDNEIVVEGKNLFNVSKISTGTFINTSTGAETTNNVWNTSDYINVRNATSITTSNSILADSSNRFEISEYNENKQWISSRQYGNNTALYFNLNLNANTKYVRIGYRNDLNFTNVQVELGTITNPVYEPYQQQVKHINLGTLEYCKIGDYKDEFYLATDSDTGLVSGKWYLKKNIGKVVLNGSEDWVVAGADNYQAGVYNLTINTTEAIAQNNSLCSHYSVYNKYAQEPNSYAITNELIRLRNVSGLSLENWKTWVSNNNVSIYYAYATPEYILLNDTLQSQINDIYYTMKSYKEQTSISQNNNDLAFTISASALLDLNSLVS